MQRVLVRFDGGAAEGTLEQRGDKLHDKRVVGGGRICHGGSPFAGDSSLQSVYSTPLARTHGVW
jgi:hypothetical protein